MAASATKRNELHIPGPGGARIEVGTITFDSDATVEVPTGLKRVLAWSFGASGNGGNAANLSVDETLNGRGEVSASGTVTVDATGNSTDTWTYQFFGY